MYKPDQRGQRYFLAHLLETYHEDLSIVNTRWETFTDPETDAILAILPHYDILMKG